MANALKCLNSKHEIKAFLIRALTHSQGKSNAINILKFRLLPLVVYLQSRNLLVFSMMAMIHPCSESAR